MTAEQAHAVAIGLYCELLRISPMDSARLAQIGIDAATGDSIWSEASREGLDEFLAWQADPAAFLSGRLRKVLDDVPADDADRTEETR